MQLKFLIDNALSPLFANQLSKNGYDANHVRDVQLQFVIVFGRTKNRSPMEQFELLKLNLDEIRDSLVSGSVIIIEDNRIRIRELPILKVL